MLIWEIIVTVLSFFMAGFFVACEFALVQTRESELQESANQDKDNGKKIPVKLKREIYMVTHLNDYLSTTQVGVSLGGILMGWVGEKLVDDGLEYVFGLSLWHMNSDTVESASAIVGLVLLTYLEVVLTEVTPKNLSTAKSRFMLGVVCTPLHYCHKLFFPLVWMINISAEQTVKIFGIHMADQTDEALSQGEILDVSRNAVKSGQLDQNDYTYMARAFKFNDKIAKDIMVDRTQLVVINDDDTVQDAINVYLKKKFSRLPVVKNNNKDNILGYVYNYDLIRQQQVNPDVKVTKLLRDVETTAETTPITRVLQRMVKTHTPLIVVVNEYGGTSGIITDKDIYDELFGTVRDEVDPSLNEFIFKQPKGSYQINGKINIYDFERYFNNEIPEFNKSDVVTLSGYFIDKYPNLHNGSSINLGGFNFKITKLENSFVKWFEVTPIHEKAKQAIANKNKAAKANQQQKPSIKNRPKNFGRFFFLPNLFL
ncbi:MAG: HlyC/CorC family transporter [Acetilactobacillus jinshanensis]